MTTKVMVLEVTGGCVEDFVFTPIYRIVEVIDPTEFIGRIRARILLRLIEYAQKGVLPEDKIDKMMITVKVKLYDTGLTSYPETPEEEAALLSAWIQPKDSNSEEIVITPKETQ